MNAPAAVEGKTLDLSAELIAFNWLPAAYAHPDWLAEWAPLLTPRSEVSVRLAQHVSRALLDRYDLRSRFVGDVGQHGWLMQPHSVVMRLADDLGLAMLGGWVRLALERREVERQVAILGPQRRNTALQYGCALRALPYPAERNWPMMPHDSDTVVKLGLSCMLALLDAPVTGARERFCLRFPRDTFCDIVLSNAAKSEAMGVIHNSMVSGAAVPDAPASDRRIN